jgi:hypothetical protein
MALPVPAGTGAYAALPPAGAMKGELPVGYYYNGGAAPPAQLTVKTIVIIVVVVIVVLIILGWWQFRHFRSSRLGSSIKDEQEESKTKLKNSKPNVRLEEAQRVREQQINEIRARVEREHAAKMHQHQHHQQQHGASTGNRLVVPPAPASRAGSVEPYAPFPASAGSSNARGPQYAGVAASNTRATTLFSDFVSANGEQKGAELEGAGVGGGGGSVFDTVWGARQSSGEPPTASSTKGTQGGVDGDDEDEGLTRFMPNMTDAVDGKDKDTNMSLFTPERLKLSNRMSGQIGGGESGGGGGEDRDDFLAKQREAGSGMKKLGKYSQLDQGRAQSIRDQYASQGARGEDAVVFNGSEYL